MFPGNQIHKRCVVHLINEESICQTDNSVFKHVHKSCYLCIYCAYFCVIVT